ncbi:MAG: hypothetical protein M1840_008599 [Geoglossum simile]|nr:MAG: hypothetical protein M1840_008599 [Geoglossum simile]
MPAHANDFEDFWLNVILVTWRKLVGGGLTDAGIPIDLQTAREFNTEIPDKILEHLHMKRSHSTNPPRDGSASSSSSTPVNRTNPTTKDEIPISSQMPNSRSLTLISDTERSHSVDVIFDLGTKDNWMSAKTVQDMVFMTKMPDSDSKPLLDFNGKRLISIGVVQAKWLHGGRLKDVKFRIAENGPFQALFGYNFLFDKGLVTINDDHPDNGLILVTDKKTTEGA